MRAHAHAISGVVICKHELRPLPYWTTYAYLFLLLFFLVFFVPLYMHEALTYLHFLLWQLSKRRRVKPLSWTPSLRKHTKSIYIFLRLHYYTVSKPLAYTYCCTICPFFLQSLCPQLETEVRYLLYQYYTCLTDCHSYMFASC